MGIDRTNLLDGWVGACERWSLRRRRCERRDGVEGEAGGHHLLCVAAGLRPALPSHPVPRLSPLTMDVVLGFLLGLAPAPIPARCTI